MKNYFSAQIITFLLFLVLLAIGCADQITTECETPSMQINNASGLSRFSQIQDQVFTPSCALSGCHDTDSPQANLILTKDQSYSNLINVNSVLHPQFVRVKPGNSAESLLRMVLMGDVSTQMPPSGRLNQDVIDSIALWIDNGALNN